MAIFQTGIHVERFQTEVYMWQEFKLRHACSKISTRGMHVARFQTGIHVERFQTEVCMWQYFRQAFMWKDFKLRYACGKISD